MPNPSWVDSYIAEQSLTVPIVSMTVVTAAMLFSYQAGYEAGQADRASWDQVYSAAFQGFLRRGYGARRARKLAQRDADHAVQERMA